MPGEGNRERLITYFVNGLGLDDDYVRANQPLFTSSKLDSLEVVNLIEFLDTELGISVNPLDISFEQLDTVDSILELGKDG